MGNPFVYVELIAQDVDKSKKFYSSLFDWKLETVKDDYTMINVGDGKGVGGGILKSPMPGGPTHWLSYVQVHDVAAALKKAKSLGAQIVVETKDIGEHGIIGVFTDPSGAPLGVWEPKK
jgi:predicted enzyme related to lactoylglutathione lyase